MIGSGSGSSPTYATVPTISGGDFTNATQPQPQGFSNGFNVSGRFDFNATSGSATLNYTVDDTVNTNLGTYYLLSQNLLGYFADSQVSNPVLSSYTAKGQVVGYIAPFTISGPGGTIPQVGTLSAFPGDPSSSNFLTSRASGLSATGFIGTGRSVILEQTVTVTFTGLKPGDTVYVDFPNGGGISAAPAPAGLILLASAGVAFAVYAVWRRRKALSGVC